MTNSAQTQQTDLVSLAPTGTATYAPSFIDRFMGWIDRLPGPYWLTYLTLFALHSILTHVLYWVDGWLPAFAFDPLGLLFPLWLWVPLAVMTYLNSVAVEALASFRPLLDKESLALEKLKYSFTTMPARGAVLNSAFWSIIYLIQTYLSYEVIYRSVDWGTSLRVVVFLIGLVTYIVGGALYYHTFRQLRLVNRTVKTVRQFNLFRLDPVYAFSRLTARTGIAWMMMLLLTLLVYPIEVSNVSNLGLYGLQVVLALAAFVLPLRSINARLVEEKRKLLDEHNRRVEAMLERLHHSVDGNKLDELENFQTAMTALSAERQVLEKIPTWPWRLGTLTGFLSAVGLPILLLLAQILIENLFGG